MRSTGLPAKRRISSGAGSTAHLARVSGPHGAVDHRSRCHQDFRCADRGQAFGAANLRARRNEYFLFRNDGAAHETVFREMNRGCAHQASLNFRLLADVNRAVRLQISRQPAGCAQERLAARNHTPVMRATRGQIEISIEAAGESRKPDFGARTHRRVTAWLPLQFLANRRDNWRMHAPERAAWT